MMPAAGYRNAGAGMKTSSAGSGRRYGLYRTVSALLPLNWMVENEEEKVYYDLRRQYAQ